MNLYFVIAAALLFAMGLVHSGLGERYILMRLFRRPDIPHLFGSDEFTKRTLRLAWHVTTIAWFGTAALLLLLASSPLDASARRLSIVIGATSFASGLVSLIGSRGRHLSWVAFMLVTGLILMGIL